VSPFLHYYAERQLLSVVMLNVVMLSVIMLSVVAPFAMHQKLFAKPFENAIRKKDFPVANCLYHQYQVLSCVLSECTLKKPAS